MAWLTPQLAGKERRQARMRLALVLVMSTLLHVAALWHSPRLGGSTRQPAELNITLDLQLSPTTSRLPREATELPSRSERSTQAPPPTNPAPQGMPKPAAPGGSPIFEATREYFLTEAERARRLRLQPQDPLQSRPLELPALGEAYAHAPGLVRSYRLGSGDTRHQYRKRNGKIVTWECPEPNPNNSFEISLCRVPP